MSRAKIIAAAIAAVLVLIIVAQNRETVETHILFLTISMPRAILLGAVAGLLTAFGVITTGRKKNTTAP